MTEKEMQEKKRNLIEKIEKLRERDKKKDKLLELYRKVYDSSYGEATALANVDLKALLETNKKHREIFRQIRLLEEELNK